MGDGPNGFCWSPPHGKNQKQVEPSSADPQFSKILDLDKNLSNFNFVLWQGRDVTEEKN
jgi:hypothetical protein